MRQRCVLDGCGLLMALAFSLSGCQPPEDKGTKGQASEKTEGARVKAKRGRAAESEQVE
jgi:hypothetical protein